RSLLGCREVRQDLVGRQLIVIDGRFVDASTKILGAHWITADPEVVTATLGGSRPRDRLCKLAVQVEIGRVGTVKNHHDVMENAVLRDDGCRIIVLDAESGETQGIISGMLY